MGLPGGGKIDLNNPKRFSEKLQWLKLYYHRPEFTTMVDKAMVKDYVAGIIGKKYVIATIGIWNNPSEIDWDTLPDRFVLKTNHGGGSSGVVVCKDKANFDKAKAIEQLNKSLMQDIYELSREWPYKNLEKKVLAEEFIGEDDRDLKDYKFFCFDGDPKFCQVISGRGKQLCSDFYDRDWNHQPFHEPQNVPFAIEKVEKPAALDEMWEIAGKLSKDKPFSRIDLYYVNERIYFGEITFFPTSGFGGFDPDDWDYKFGEMIHLEKVTKCV